MHIAINDQDHVFRRVGSFVPCAVAVVAGFDGDVHFGFTVSSLTLVVDVVGWAGAIAILGAYALVSTRRVAGDSLKYQILNIVGSLFLASNTLYYGAYPSALVNILWMGIAFYSIRLVIRKAIFGNSKGRGGGEHA